MMQRALDTTANSTVSGETNTAEVPAVTNAALASAQDTVKKAGFDVATIGTGNKRNQSIAGFTGVTFDEWCHDDA